MEAHRTPPASSSTPYALSFFSLATPDVLPFQPHAPHTNSLTAFVNLEDEIKRELVKLRHHWDKHEPRMFAPAKDIADEELTSWRLEEDLVEIRSASSPYGSIIFGKLRIPALTDSYIHVRIHDTPGDGQANIKFHSILTDEIRNDEDKVVEWRVFQSRGTALEFFNE
ncbi:hypothetical protein JCM10207_003500 [Rhodosporidiobolus poonsookiae]